MKVIALVLLVACSSRESTPEKKGSASKETPSPHESVASPPASITPCVLKPGFFDTEDALKTAAGDCPIVWGERPMALLECGDERKKILARSLPGRRVIAVRCALIDAVR